jgi:tetratricopeptide (TPR) repeat protein
MATVAEAFEQAVRCHRAGQLVQAEQLYRRVLQLDPHHAEALHLLGALAHQTGDSAAAIESMRRAVALGADRADVHTNLGAVYNAVGRLEEALACYEQALRRDPSYAGAHFGRAVALDRLGRQEEALAGYGEVVRLQPGRAEAQYNRGVILQAQGETDEARACYERVLRLQPGHAGAHCNLGNILREKGRLAEAAVCYQQAAQLQPDLAVAHYNLGNALRELGRLEEAVTSYRQCLRCDPESYEAHANLGLALSEQGQVDEAIASLEQARQLRPEAPEAHANLGVVYAEQRRWEQALACYDEALRLQPGHVETHWNRALLWLQLGDWERGWPEFEWRLEYPRLRLKREFPQPRWDGGDLAGKTILLYTEGGFGDALHFARYLPLVAGRGGRVVLECQPELKTLFQSVGGVDTLVARGEPLPPFDVRCPLQSLPLAFGTTLATIPADIPYLAADPGQVAAWRQRLANGGPGLRVGLVWSGSPKPMRVRNPNLTLEGFAPLAGVQGITFYSVQKGEPAVQARRPPHGMTLIDPTRELADFAATAALLMNLDLLISVDTSVVHLAGALGRPVWVLLTGQPDFRWLLDREDSPWYPSMRLFRQVRRDDWAEVIQRVARELASSAALGTK